MPERGRPGRRSTRSSGPATPHFAYQLRARVRELVARPARGPPGAALRARRRWSCSTGSATPRRRPHEGAARAARRGSAGRRSRASAPADEPLPRAAMSFEGASVLVTGGSRGIGRAIALRFAERGAARVAIGYLRNDSAAEETAEELRAAGAEPVLLRGNVASERVAAEVGGARAARRARAQRGDRRDPARARDRGQALGLDAERERPRVPRRSPARPRRRCRDGSSIVGISSLGSTRVLENYVLVGTSKAALEALVRYLAVELAPRGIRVNAVSAGVVETGALDHFPNREQMLSSAAASARPAGRLVEPDDVADAVCFLCSPEAAMIRGQTLVVDGGFSAPGLMEPTDTNLRAWEEAHKRIRRSSARGSRTLPKPVRERMPDIGGRHVLHLACGAGRRDGGADEPRRARHRRRRVGGDRRGRAQAAARRGAGDRVAGGAAARASPRPLRRRLLVVGRAGRRRRPARVDCRDRVGAEARAGSSSSTTSTRSRRASTRCCTGTRATSTRGRSGRLIHALGGAGLALELLEELPDPNRWGRREVRVPGDLIVVARKP